VVPLNAASNLRLSLIVAVPVGALVTVVLALLGHPLAGAYVFLGLGFGVVNGALVRRSVARCVQSGRRPNFVGGALYRLAIFSALSIGIAFLDRPDGMGTLLGLALFQAISIGSAAFPLLRELRRT
jgi:hypothetical protein